MSQMLSADRKLDRLLEMRHFINANPGLESKFNRYIEFDDYSSNEPEKIYELNVKKNEFILDDDAKKKVARVISNAVSNKDWNFCNARFARNLFERTLENQAARLANTGRLTKNILRHISS